MPSFGQRLRNIIQERKINREEIAHLLGVSLRAVYYYETEKREPTIEQLIKLSDFFGVSLDYLVGRTDDPTVRK